MEGLRTPNYKLSCCIKVLLTQVILMIITRNYCRCKSMVLYEFNGNNNGSIQTFTEPNYESKWKFKEQTWTRCLNDTYEDQLKLPRLSYGDIFHSFYIIIRQNIAIKSRSTFLTLNLGLTESYQIPVSAKTWVSGGVPTRNLSNLLISLVATRFCGRIEMIKISVAYCNLPAMDTSPAIALLTSGSIMKAECVKNAMVIQTLSLQCESSDDNYKVSGICSCQKGFQLSRTGNGTECTECGPYQYKDVVGNSPCLTCGANSHSKGRGIKDFCECDENYHRLYKEIKNPSADCYRTKFSCPLNISFGDENYKGKYFLKAPHAKPIGTTAQMRCKYGWGTIFARCFLVEIDILEWLIIDDSNCNAKTETSNQILKLKQESINQSNIIYVSSTLKEILKANASSIETSKDVDNAIDVIENVLKINYTVQEVNENLLQAADFLANVNESVSRESKSRGRMLRLLNMIAEGNLANTNETFYEGENIALIGNTVYLQGGDLLLTAIQNSSSIGIITSQRAGSTNTEKVPAQIRVSQKTLITQSLIGKKFFSYLFNNNLFFVPSPGVQKKSGNLSRVGSYIMSLTFLDTLPLRNLENPIQMNFQVVHNLSNTGSSRCSFWNENIQGKESDWSTKGCKRIGSTTKNNQHIMNCICDHLTNFAVIFTPEKYLVENKPNKILDVISYVGMGISIVALLFTLLTYIVFKKLSQKTPQKILINFCFSLLCLLVIFTAGINQTHKVVPCKVIASLIQFFLMSTFFWMAIEGVGLFRKIVRSTQNLGDDKKFFKICLAVGWGIPAVVCVCSAIIFKEENHPTVCMLPWQGFISTTVILLVIMTLNISLFVPIIREIQRHVKTRAERFQIATSPVKRVMVTISCTLLLGLTWVFGVFLLIEELQDVFQWLFCIFNTLQGFFIFVFHVLRNDEVMKQWKEVACKKNINGAKNNIIGGTKKSDLTARFEGSRKNFVVDEKCAVTVLRK